MTDEVKLNLGAGSTPVPGFLSIDRKDGKEVYPLEVPDESVDVIRASHVLEHFSHLKVAEIVRHWVSKLKPGGLIKIAVPDFEKIARDYLEGKNFPIEEYLFGGHIDDDDHHGVAFDKELLSELFLNAGLTRLHTWTSEIQDCASIPHSLNLAGYKPLSEIQVCKNTTAILSAPRYGPVLHFRLAMRAFGRAGVPYQPAGGAYWHQILSELMEEHIANEESQYVITCDYDTVFRYEDVLDLYRLMEACPDVDALFPLQMKRGNDSVALFGLEDAKGNPLTEIPLYQIERNVLPAKAGHFGLTIFRCAALRDLPRPWMLPEPSADGRWGDGKVDADIDFWRRFKAAGKKACLAPRVVVGHLQELVTWPDRVLKPIYQTVPDFDASGMPEEARR